MLPTFTTLDPTYSALSNAVIGSNKTLEPCVVSNGMHLLKCQFCRSAAFTAVRRAVTYPIGLVGFWCVPSQVSKVVVPRIAVIMTAFHSIRSGTNKRCKHRGVWPKNLLLVAAPQKKERAVFFFVVGKRFDFSGFHGAYTTVIGNLVKVFKANNGEPVFHSHTIGILNRAGNP